MNDRDEFDGDACIVLPKDYMKSAQAVAEIYEDELAEAATSFEIDSMRPRPRLFKGSLLVTVLWTLPAVWSVCL